VLVLFAVNDIRERSKCSAKPSTCDEPLAGLTLLHSCRHIELGTIGLELNIADSTIILDFIPPACGISISYGPQRQTSFLNNKNTRCVELSRGVS
jgi:hypothetical protein